MKQVLSKEERVRLKVRLITDEVKQADVAANLGMDPGYLSRILNGRQSVGEEFVGRFNTAVDQVRAPASDRELVPA